MCVKSLGCRMFAFQCDAVSRLKSLTAITLKCMYLRTRWLRKYILPDKISLNEYEHIFLEIDFLFTV